MRLDKHRSIERFNRTLQVEWAYRQVFTSNHQRTQALESPRDVWRLH